VAAIVEGEVVTPWFQSPHTFEHRDRLAMLNAVKRWGRQLKTNEMKWIDDHHLQVGNTKFLLTLDPTTWEKQLFQSPMSSCC